VGSKCWSTVNHMIFISPRSEEVECLHIIICKHRGGDGRIRNLGPVSSTDRSKGRVRRFNCSIDSVPLSMFIADEETSFV